MGKIYIDTVKYIIRANIEILGLVEKPDVVGAVFGQTEGLLGEELDIRELQKNGRIGRIEVTLTVRGNKSYGVIEVPSSLDLIETSIIGAALETVDRVGPCEAHLVVERIEDTRNLKRKQVIQRAKELVKQMLLTQMPDRKEISELVRAEVKTSEITTFGFEKLAAGPGIEDSDSIIIVEGRADVINLLKCDIDNVVSVGGANVPKSIIDLCRRKEVTLFLDGDRGGDIILRELTHATDIDFVARAPLGREVEELARKEVLKALRSRVPVEQADSTKATATVYRPSSRPTSSYANRDRTQRTNSRYPPKRDVRQSLPPRNDGPRTEYSESSTITRNIERVIEAQKPTSLPPRNLTSRTLPPTKAPSRYGTSESSTPAPVSSTSASPPAAPIPPEILTEITGLEGTLKARFFDSSMKMLTEVPIRDIAKTLETTENVNAIVMDGIITQRMIDVTESKNIKVLAGIKMGNVFRKPSTLTIHVKQIS